MQWREIVWKSLDFAFSANKEEFPIQWLLSLDLVDRRTSSSEVLCMLWVSNSRNNVTSHSVTDLEEKALQKCYFITDLIQGTH